MRVLYAHLCRPALMSSYERRLYSTGHLAGGGQAAPLELAPIALLLKAESPLLKRKVEFPHRSRSAATTRRLTSKAGPSFFTAFPLSLWAAQDKNPITSQDSPNLHSCACAVCRTALDSN